MIYMTFWAFKCDTESILAKNVSKMIKTKLFQLNKAV